MNATPSAIPDVLLIEPDVYSDDRGFFFEVYQSKKYSEIGLPDRFVQDNHSGSKKGTIRGLHYQIRQPQGKLVWVLQGEIFDVAVDLRRSSPSYGSWVSSSISSENRRQVWIPEGFAHGFLVISEWAEVMYKVTEFYSPEWERTLLWNDPNLGINWPLKEIGVPILSAKDQRGKPLELVEVFD